MKKVPPVCSTFGTQFILLLFIFGIIFGLNGIKVLMYYTIPCILMFVVITIYLYINNKKSISFYKPLSIGTGISLLSTGIGVGIYLFVFCKIYTCYPSFNTIWGQLDISNLLLSASHYLQLFGFNDNGFSEINIISIYGPLLVFGLINAIAFVFCLISLLRNKYFKTCKDQLLFIFIVCALFSGTIIFSLTQEVYNATYWLPFLPLGMIVIELFIESIKEHCLNTKFIRTILLCSFMICSIYSNDCYLPKYPNRYEGMHETTNWLLEHDCKKVIAEFWAANAMAEYSDGKIEVFVINNYGDFSIYNYLQEKRHISAPLDKDVYVVIPSIDEKHRDLSYLSEHAEVVKNDTDLIVYRIK